MASKNDASPGSAFGIGIQSAVTLLFKQGVVVTSVKVKYPGIDPLLIVTAATTEGPKIAFTGGQNLDVIGNNFHKAVLSDAVPWKEDQFTLQRLAQNEE